MIKQLIRRLISVSIWLLPCFHFWLECLGKYLQSVAFQLWENCFFSIHSAAKPKIFAFPMAITNAFCTHQRHILSIHIPIDTRGRFRMQVNAECYLSGRTEKKVKIIMKCIGISLTYPQSTSIKLKCNHHAGVAFQYFVMHLTMLITKSNAINMAFFAPFRSCCKQFLHFTCGHIFQLGFSWLWRWVREKYGPFTILKSKKIFTLNFKKLKTTGIFYLSCKLYLLKSSCLKKWFISKYLINTTSIGWIFFDYLFMLFNICTIMIFNKLWPYMVYDKQHNIFKILYCC